MKNKEFYKDDIYKLACKRDRFAVNKFTEEIDSCSELDCSDCLFFNLLSKGSCGNQAVNWLEQEHIEPILNNAEKQYLENFIRPFKSRVKSVTKRLYSNDYAYIQLYMKSAYELKYELINLPLFVRDKMYQRMLIEKEYTIEELELFENEKK